MNRFFGQQWMHTMRDDDDGGGDGGGCGSMISVISGQHKHAHSRTSIDTCKYHSLCPSVFEWGEVCGIYTLSLFLVISVVLLSLLPSSIQMSTLLNVHGQKVACHWQSLVITTTIIAIISRQSYIFAAILVGINGTTTSPPAVPGSINSSSRTSSQRKERHIFHSWKVFKPVYANL